MPRTLLTRVAGVGAAAAIAGAAARRRAVGRAVRADLGTRRIRTVAPGDVRLSVVVPAFREERIGTTVARLRDELAEVADDGGLEIVVVDDGSGDDTARLAEEAGADVVVRQPVNQGKGAAVRAGVLASRGRTVAFTDADLAYAPDQLRKLLTEVEHGWDVAVGSRRHAEATATGEAGLVRELGSKAVNLSTRLVLRAPHADTQCGLKAFRSDVARLVFAHTRIDGFAFDIEVLHLAERYQLSLVEVPVAVENSTRSTVRVARDALRLLGDLVRIRALARRGAYGLDPDGSAVVRTPDIGRPPRPVPM